MAPAAIAGLAQAGIGIAQGIGGMIQAKKARNELEGLEQPFYKIQEELFQNRNLAAQQAQMGVPQATMDYITSETQRGLGSSVSALRQTGGSANNVSDLFAQYQRGIQQNAAMDAQQRVANLGGFLKENQELAGQKTMQWAINEFQPFQNKVQALQGRIAQGNQMIGGGLSNVLGGAASYGTATQNSDLIAQLKALGQKGGAVANATSQTIGGATPSPSNYQGGTGFQNTVAQYAGNDLATQSSGQQGMDNYNSLMASIMSTINQREADSAVLGRQRRF